MQTDKDNGSTAGAVPFDSQLAPPVGEDLFDLETIRQDLRMLASCSAGESKKLAKDTLKTANELFERMHRAQQPRSAADPVRDDLLAHLRAIELRVDGFNQKFTSVKAETRSMLDSIKTHCRDADGKASAPQATAEARSAGANNKLEDL